MVIEKNLQPDVMNEKCPSRVFLNHITSRWGGLVLLSLQGQKLRYSELRRTIGGVSERMLAQTLKTLEEDGFVHRKSFDVVPPHVEYSLTDHGDAVTVRLKELATWLENNFEELMAQKNARIAKSGNGQRAL